MFWYGGEEEYADKILFGIGKVASVVDPEGQAYFASQSFTWKYWYYDECSTMVGDEVITPPLHTTHILSPFSSRGPRRHAPSSPLPSL